jgi:hypothetical protein
MCTQTEEVFGVPKPSTPMRLPVNTARPPVRDERSRIVPGPRCRMMRRASTGHAPRTRARRQSGDAVADIIASGDFLNRSILDRSDSIKLKKQHDMDDSSKRMDDSSKQSMDDSSGRRRKPRRVSAMGDEEIRGNMSCLLQLDNNSAHLFKKRMPVRRASVAY